MVQRGTSYRHSGFDTIDLEDFLDSLPPQTGLAARRAWIEGDTEEEIGRLLGVRQQRVSELLADARAKLTEAEGR
jgi:RNA polymerase sigma factor (sigma-70 family)